MLAQFSPAAVELRAGPHLATLTLRGAGCEAAPRAVAPVAPEERGGRVVYRHQGVEQWYEAGPRGVEQGFTFPRAPAGCGASLRLDLEVGGDLSPSLAGDRVLFRDGAGVARLGYGELATVDAAGRTLPSKLAVEGGHLALLIDARDAVYPVVVDPLIGVPGQVLPGLASEVNFGNSVAVFGDMAAVGAPDDDDAGVNTGAVYLYKFQAGAWSSWRKLTRAGAQGADLCGGAVALSATTLLVGCPEASGGLGAVAAWSLAGPEPVEISSDFFVQFPASTTPKYGTAIALDGTTAAISAVGEGQALGVVRIFDFDGASWKQTAAFPGSSNQFLGTTLALRGGLLVAGNPYDNASQGGTAVLFERTAGQWLKTTTLVDPNPDVPSSDAFGSSVATDGTDVFVGAPHAGSGEGAIYVAQKSGGWAVSTTLADKSLPPLGELGSSLVVDGARLLTFANDKSGNYRVLGFAKQAGVWSSDSSSTTIPAPGGALSFNPTQLGFQNNHLALGLPGGGDAASVGALAFADWQAPKWGDAKIYSPSPGTRDDLFGQALERDGDWLLVGAPGETADRSKQGGAVMFSRKGGQWGAPVSLDLGYSDSEKVGASVALKGNWAFVGHPGYAGGAGVVSVFQLNGSSWANVGSLSAFGANSPSGFGTRLSFDGVTLAVGAADGSDKVLLFEYFDPTWQQVSTLSPADTPLQSFGLGFGDAFAVQGNLLLVSSINTGDNAGSVHVFEKVSGWAYKKTLYEPGSKPQRYFGTGLALDSAVAFINGNSSSGPVGPGAVYAFDTKTWAIVQTLDNPKNALFFGDKMRLRGGTLAVRSYFEPSSPFYFFRQQGGSWQNVGKFDSQGGQYTTAIDVDGDTFFVGVTPAGERGSVVVGSLLLEPGALCSAGSECASGFCADGVCCDTACSGPCLVCSSASGAKTSGVCEPRLAGTPQAACPTSVDPCGAEGQCDGKGACTTSAASGKACGKACSSGNLSLLSCDGLGSCSVTSGEQSCGAYLCQPGPDGDQCPSSCETSAQCAAPYVCIGGACVSPLDSGAPCKTNGDCSTGFCADGVCCNAACDGPCQACSKLAGAPLDGACGSTCPDGVCQADDSCQPAGGSGGQGGAGAAGQGGAGQGGAGSGGSGQAGSRPGLPDLWHSKPDATGGQAGAAGAAGAGGNAEGGAAGAYVRPKVAPLAAVDHEAASSCGCRAAGERRSAPALPLLALVGLLVARKKRS